MTPILAIVRKEWRLLAREPGALALLFVLPSVFILVFSLALQGAFSTGPGEERMDVLVLDEDGSDAGRRIAEAITRTRHFRPVSSIEGTHLTRDLLEREIASGGHPIAVIVPAGATSSTKGGPETTVEVLADPLVSEAVIVGVEHAVRTAVDLIVIDELERSVEEMDLALTDLDDSVREIEQANSELLEALLEMHGHLEKAVRLMPPSMRPDVSLEEMEAREARLEQEMEEAAERTSRPAVERPHSTTGLRVEARRASRGREIRPTSVQQNVPGWTIFGLFWIAQILALSLIMERQSGAYARIRVAPVSLASYLTGKAAAYLGVNVVQAVLMMGMGVWILPLLGAPPLVIPDLPSTALVTLATSLCAISLGLCIASLTRSAFAAASVSATLLVIMTALAGIMVPKFVMPGFMQAITLAVPQGWALDAYHDILVRNLGVRAVLPEIAALLAFTAAFLSVALWRLRARDPAS